MRFIVALVLIRRNGCLNNRLRLLLPLFIAENKIWTDLPSRPMSHRLVKLLFASRRFWRSLVGAAQGFGVRDPTKPSARTSLASGTCESTPGTRSVAPLSSALLSSDSFTLLSSLTLFSSQLLNFSLISPFLRNPYSPFLFSVLFPSPLIFSPVVSSLP